MTDPWAFGWTQLFTVVGFAITIAIAFGGFRTFDRWRREKIEEKKIEVAFDALTVAYKTKFVFQHIRGVMAHGYEWADMPIRDGETEDKRNRRGPFFATFKRIQQNKEFFDSVWELQPKCMAVFGREMEETFVKLHKARRSVEVAAQMLADRIDDHFDDGDESTRKFYRKLERDVWDHGTFEPEKEEVGKLLREFELELEAAARPIVDRNYNSKL